MWLYCLCGVGNLGPFGGTASGLLAFHTHFLFQLSSMTHSQHVCVWVAKSAVVMYSVVQLFVVVVSSFVHSPSTHLQSVNKQLESALRQSTLAMEVYVARAFHTYFYFIFLA